MAYSLRVFRHITFLELGQFSCFSWPLTSSAGVSVLKRAASQVLRCCTVKYTTLTRSIRRQAAVRSLWTPRAPATARVCGGAGTLMSARSWEDVLTPPTPFSCTRYSLCLCSIPRSGPHKSSQHPHIPNRFQLAYNGFQVYIKINRGNLISRLTASTHNHFTWHSHQTSSIFIVQVIPTWQNYVVNQSMPLQNIAAFSDVTTCSLI